MTKKTLAYIKKTAIYGMLSAVLYAAVFTNTSTLMPFFTAGSYLAALPIATAFLFSFVHGAFASNLWSALGIEATKAQPTARVTTRVRPAKRQRPRLRLQA